MRAIRENRVLTVKQNPVGSKADVGTIGFHEDRDVSYFIFPEPLPESKGAKVIGINYDLLEVDKPVGRKISSKPTKQPAKKPEPEKREISVTIKRTATIETTVKVEATGLAEAENLALAEIREQPFDGKKAIIKDEVRAIRK